MLTGRKPEPGIEYPHLGAVVAKLLGTDGQALPGTGERSRWPLQVAWCQTARNVDPRLECTPAGGQGQAADLTICRVCSCSNLTGLRYPSAEWSRLLL